LHAPAIMMMPPNNTTISTAPIYYLPDLKRIYSSQAWFITGRI
jgi:hypothetical protein